MNDLITHLRARGFTLTIVAGSLRVRPASTLTQDDRDAIRGGLPALIAALTVGEPWDGREAIRLMSDADALVEQLGMSGRHPAIQNAAAVVSSAYATRDLETVRFACSAFAVTVRELAASAHPGGSIKPCPTIGDRHAAPR